MTTFYLGTHCVPWLGTIDVPLFISRRQLMARKSFPRALAPWVLDSGGFSQLNAGAWFRRTHSPYDCTTAEYADEVDLYRREIGLMDWAAPMDWMCEPLIIWKHGLGVQEHQRRTILSFLDLRDRLGDLVVPVLQGWTVDDYLRHIDSYQRAGVDLTAERIVGVGSVCRRGQDGEIVRILDTLARQDIRLHAFGIRSRALARIWDAIVSADSLAWSRQARLKKDASGDPVKMLPTCTHAAKNCANCLDWALVWRDRQAHHLRLSEDVCLFA